MKFVSYDSLNADEKKQIDHIFFENSKKIFSSEQEKSKFREKWLTPYFSTNTIFLALVVSDIIAGYVNGRTVTENTIEEFEMFEREFPAHLHINIAKEFQSKGYGRLLIDEFIRSLPKDILGVHIITGAKSRNIRFYEGNGFRCLGHNQNKTVVFMGRYLKG